MSRKVAFKTLGCRLNQYETDAIAHEFRQHGYELVDFEEEADVYVVNTCTVTNQSDHKSRYEIHRAGKHRSVLVVTGCMATSAREQLEQRKEITYVVENDRKKSVFSLVDAHFRGEILHPNDLEKDVFGYPVADRVFHTRSLVKIQDGCNNFCTFCIVPFVRGRAASRPVSQILDNVTQVIDHGSREVVITGVNIGRYQHEETNFETLIEKILGLPGDFRLRISSLEPEGFGDRFFELFSHPRLTPHLHLCLQSGSDNILLKMRRTYTIGKYMNMVNKLRSKYPGFNLTTDIMVGFPSECDEDFEETCCIAHEVGFSHIHTFKFSVRKGTRAERMTNRIPEGVKNIRSERIREIADYNKRIYRESFVGNTQEVLIETADEHSGQGYGEHYVPVEVILPGLKNNDLVKAKITAIRDGEEPVLVGEPM
jgi:threonylcarbamoyladenosine tRNA methylthiotransferase MtaB